MEQTLLTPAQKTLLSLVAGEPRLASFYLTGDIALTTYYLKHRISDDLDFFTFEEPDKTFLREFAGRIKEKLQAGDIRYERLYDRNLFFFNLNNEELKIEFSRYPFHRLDETKTEDGIAIDSLRDIAANKLMALTDRFDPKDFVDIYFIAQTTELKNIRTDVVKKFDITLDDMFLGGEFAKARRIEALPRMIKPLTIEQLKAFFEKEAKKLESSILE